MKRTRLSKNIAVFLLTLAAALAVAGQPPKQEQLLNGLNVLLFPDAKADKVAVRVRVHAGSAFDPQGKEGTMQLLADNLFPNEASREFFRDDLGGDLEVVTTYDYIQINASSSPDQFLTMLETVASALSNPAIDKETTAKLRTALAAKLKANEADPSYEADTAVSARLLGTFPYGRPRMGSSSSIQNVSFADLIDAKLRFLTADNATLAISGNFDRSLASKAVRRYFGGWTRSDRRVPYTFKQPDDPPSGVLIVSSPQPNVAVVRVALRSTARGAKDHAASEIYARILEARLRARMPAESSGGAFVRNETYVQPGLLVMGFLASKNDVDSGRGSGNGKIEASGLIAKILADPITEAEFASAKSETSGLWQKKRLEDLYLDADTYKLAPGAVGTQAIDRVTLADVREFAGRLGQQPLATVLLISAAK